jgi:hypothetical protein
VVRTITTYLRDVPALVGESADGVVTAEAEVAFAFAERLLRDAGASEEEIDQARQRVRDDLVAPTTGAGHGA